MPTDHHVARPLRIWVELGGKHSRKTAASTGRLPPTPRPKQAYKAHVLFSESIKRYYARPWKNLPNPVRPTSSGEAKRTANAKRHVESRTASNSIGSNTPERGTDNKTHKQSTSCKARLILRDAKFHGDGCQCESNSLSLISPLL